MQPRPQYICRSISDNIIIIMCRFSTTDANIRLSTCVQKIRGLLSKHEEITIDREHANGSHGQACKNRGGDNPGQLALIGWRALRAKRKGATNCRPARLFARGSRRSSVDPRGCEGSSQTARKRRLDDRFVRLAQKLHHQVLPAT